MNMENQLLVIGEPICVPKLLFKIRTSNEVIEASFRTTINYLK